ncbi:MAG: hypothetical protein JJU11_03245 [Candidatus Sumerlaeia bacterium]|nr:hypothetical protein [Candidatus Sumerlaeia bacterium]
MFLAKTVQQYRPPTPKLRAAIWFLLLLPLCLLHAGCSSSQSNFLDCEFPFAFSIVNLQTAEIKTSQNDSPITEERKNYRRFSDTLPTFFLFRSMDAYESDGPWWEWRILNLPWLERSLFGYHLVNRGQPVGHGPNRAIRSEFQVLFLKIREGVYKHVPHIPDNLSVERKAELRVLREKEWYTESFYIPFVYQFINRSGYRGLARTPAGENLPMLVYMETTAKPPISSRELRSKGKVEGQDWANFSILRLPLVNQPLLGGLRTNRGVPNQRGLVIREFRFLYFITRGRDFIHKDATVQQSTPEQSTCR